jgi:transposase
MTSNDLYSQILGLASPWRVQDVVLNINDQTVHVYVAHDPSLGRLRCDTCGSECPGYDTQSERFWRHLDTMQFMTYLVCSIPRVQCPTHGVRPAQASWTEPNSHFTLLFEAWAIAVLRATKVQSQAATLLRISSDSVHGIMVRAVERGMARRSPDTAIRHIALDEKAISAGHEYLTVLCDADRGIVLDLAHTRTQAATQSLLRSALSPAQQRKVKCVTMDMWKAFANATKEVLPHAAIAHDRFHIAKHLNEAVDKTRRSEHARLAKEGASPLSKSRYLWLKNPENLTDAQNALFLSIMQNDLVTAKVWTMKDTFRGFFDCSKVKKAATFFENWYEQAKRVGAAALTKVAEMLNNHRDGLLAIIKHKATNAIAEAVNSKIQAIKTSARGYRGFKNYRTAILFYYGGLQLNP